MKSTDTIDLNGRVLFDWVMRDAAEIEFITLPGDGRYQNISVTLTELTERVADLLRPSIKSTAELPILFCSWGKCRVGSTALTNLFGIAGVPAFYQPVKTIARHLLVGDTPSLWQIPDRSAAPNIYSKEMGGPYLLAEALFNPLKALVMAGYPKERLHLIMLDRDPYRSAASWIEKWSTRLPEKILVRNFIVSSLNAIRMKRFADTNGIRTTQYVYELSKQPLEAIKLLFQRLGVSGLYSTTAITDWKDAGDLGSSKSKIIFPQEPKVFSVPGLHGHEVEYRYKERDRKSLSSAVREQLEAAGLIDLYNKAVQRCIEDLGVSNQLRVCLELYS